MPRKKTSGFPVLGIIIIILVIFAALIGYSYLPEKTVETASHSPIPKFTEHVSVSPTQTPISGKTYTNSILGIQFDYPSDWKVEEDVNAYITGPIISLLPPNSEPFVSYLSINLDNRQFKNIAEIEAFYEEQAANHTYEMSEVTIGTYKAYAFTRTDLTNSKEIYLFHNGKVYLFATATYDLGGTQEILSSVKFIK